MERYKVYLLPGVAALLLLAYYVWRWTSSGAAPEPEVPAKATKATKAASEPKAAAEKAAAEKTAEPSQPSQ
jgi:hypothetical protein